MDSFRLDALARALGSSANRRVALAAVAIAVGAHGLGAPDESDAEKRKKKRRCKPRCGACEQCVPRAGKPTQDGTRCGKHKHCERGLCVACARNGDDCAQINAAACCSGRCCDGVTGNCPAGVDFCSCKQ